MFRLRQTSADGDFKSLAPGSFETQLELMDARGRASYTINSVKKTIQRRLGDKEVKILALESQITDVSQENERLTQQLRKERSDINGFQTEIDSELGNSLQVEDYIRKKEEILGEAHTKCNGLRIKLRAHTTQLEGDTFRKQRTERANGILQTRLRDINAATIEEKSKQAQMTQEMDELLRRSRELKDGITSYARKMRTMSYENARANESSTINLDTETNKIAELNGILKAQRSRLDFLAKASQALETVEHRPIEYRIESIAEDIKHTYQDLEVQKNRNLNLAEASEDSKLRQERVEKAFLESLERITELKRTYAARSRYKTEIEEKYKQSITGTNLRMKTAEDCQDDLAATSDKMQMVQNQFLMREKDLGVLRSDVKQLTLKKDAMEDNARAHVSDVQIADTENKRLEAANSARAESLLTIQVRRDRADTKVIKLKSCVSIAHDSLVQMKQGIRSANQSNEGLVIVVANRKGSSIEGKDMLARRLSGLEMAEADSRKTLPEVEEAMKFSASALDSLELKLAETKDGNKSENYLLRSTIKDTELENCSIEERSRDATIYSTGHVRKIADLKKTITQLRAKIEEHRIESKRIVSKKQMIEADLAVQMRERVNRQAAQYEELKAIEDMKPKYPLAPIEKERNQALQKYEMVSADRQRLRAEVNSRMELLDETTREADALSKDAVRKEFSVEGLLEDKMQMENLVDDSLAEKKFQGMVLRDGINSKLILFKNLQEEQMKYRELRTVMAALTEKHSFEMQEMRETRVQLESSLIDQTNAMDTTAAKLDAQDTYNEDLLVLVGKQRAADSSEATELELELNRKREKVNAMYATTLDEDLLVAKLGLKRDAQKVSRRVIKSKTEMVLKKESDEDNVMMQNQFEANMIEGAIETSDNQLKDLRRRIGMHVDQLAILASQESAFEDTYKGFQQQIRGQQIKQRILTRESEEKAIVTDALLSAVEQQKLNIGQIGFHESILEMREKSKR